VWAQADDVTCASIGYIELRAMIARRLSGRTASRAGLRLDLLWASIDTVPLDDELVADAVRIADGYRLRALGAIHLAAATQAQDDDLVLATWDEELRLAAQAAGFATFP
jgi:predicted nucleic acid-binding protein